MRPFIALPKEKELIAVLPPLIQIEPSATQTYFANGSWRDSNSSAEFLCHSVEASDPSQGSMRLELPIYSIRPQVLPRSETEGSEELRSDPGIVLNNLPPQPDTYIHRDVLEERLKALLLDTGKRHVINVRGIGGIGKTSLVIELAHDLAADATRCPYAAIIWISARDIDLRLSGARDVKRGSETMEDVWKRFASLFGAEEAESREFFEETLRGSDPYLVILDNFETFDDQSTAYAYLDELVHPPSKVLITSRHVFTDDYGLEVRGMAFEEARQLLVQAARQAGREPLMTEDAMRRIYERAQGHPYAMKLIAAHVTSIGGLTAQMTDVLRRGDLLDALFRRSLQDLADNEDAIFLFLLIGQFSRGLPEPALAVIAEREEFNLNDALQDLTLRSLIEIVRGEPVRYDMPAMAREFAQQRSHGHVLEPAVTAARDFLRTWPDLVNGRTPEAAEAIAKYALENPDGRKQLLQALESLAGYEPDTWALVARVAREANANPSYWEAAYERAIEHDPGRADILWEWSEVAPDADKRIALKVKAVQADPENIAIASRVAHLLNAMFAKDRDQYTLVRWTSLMSPIIEALHRDFDGLDGEGLSRLAWLNIHLAVLHSRSEKYERAARRAVERGLAVDCEHESILKLARRMKIRV